MNEAENHSPSEKCSPKIQLLIFAAAFVVRLGFLLTQIPEKKFIGADSHLYLEIAANLLDGNGFATGQNPTAFVSPGYPLFLAACLKIFGENLLWAGVLQCLCASLTCVVIAKIAARVFGGASVGLTAGLIAAFFYELVMYASSQLLTEPLYIFFLAPAIYSLVSALLDKQKWCSFLPAGIFFGLAGIVRPLAFPIAVSVSLMLIIIFVRRKKGAAILHPLTLVCACILVMTPWGLRNYLTMNHFTILSLEGGHVFWLGNNPDYDKYENPDFTKFGGYTAMFKSFPEEVLQSGTEVEANAAFYKAAQRHIFEHPLEFVRRGFHKTWNMWRPTFSRSLARNLIVSWTVYPLLLFSALGAMLFCLKSKRFGAKRLAIYVLCWIFLTHLAIHFGVTGEIRFRVPLWIILIPFAAYFLTEAFFLLIVKMFPRAKLTFQKRIEN